MEIIAFHPPRPESETLSTHGQQHTEVLPRAAYVHVPFCRTHCRYCDFAVTVGTEALIERYVEALIAEIELTPGARQGLTSLYFGGGTPSLLTPGQLERVLLALDRQFALAPTAEISLEANPGTFDRAQLSAYRSLGINRLSLGVQAFQEPLLRMAGRSHGVREVYGAIDCAVAAGFDNFNLDVMYGLPHQTIADWVATLDIAVAARPAHISLYDLILEEATPFGRRYRPGEAPLPSDEETVEMYLRAVETLTGAGYEHYEIANFARPGRRCAHNLVYWHNGAHYGIGCGATGYVHCQRIERPRRLKDYFDWVALGEFNTVDPPSRAEELTDTLLFGLRLIEGFLVADLEERFGPGTIRAVLEQLKPAQQKGWLVFDGLRLRLAFPDGVLYSNEVFQLLI